MLKLQRTVQRYILLFSDMGEIQYSLRWPGWTDSKRDGVPNRYATAGEVPAIADWDRVVTVRIGLLANSVDELLTGTGNREYYMLGVQLGPFADTNLMRRISTTTTVLENYLYDH